MSDNVTKDRPWPVAETVSRFTDLLSARGVTTFADHDVTLHGACAACAAQ